MNLLKKLSNPHKWWQAQDITVHGTLSDKEVEYFKDLLGGSQPTPGSPLAKALGATTKPSYINFPQMVRDLVAQIDGWVLYGYEVNVDGPGHRYMFTCPHGLDVDHFVTQELLVKADSLDNVALCLIKQVRKRCETQHDQLTAVQEFSAATDAFVKELQGITESFAMEPLTPAKLHKDLQEQIAKAYGIPLKTIIPDPAHKPGHYSYIIEAIDENGVAKEVGGGGYPKATLSWADAPKLQPGVYPYKFTPPKFEMSGLHITDLTPLDELAELVPALKTVAVGHPETPEDCCTEPVGREQTIGYMIVHLNDKHHWSRERIADWLDELAQTQDVDLTIRAASSGD